MSASLTKLPGTLADADRALEATTPFARRLPRTLQALSPATRDLPDALRAIRPLARDARLTIVQLRGGLSAEGPPLARALASATGSLRPVLPHLTGAAAVLGRIGNLLHYLRLVLPVTTEVLGVAPERQPFNRANPYPAPGSRAAFAAEAPLSFGCDHVKTRR